MLKNGSLWAIYTASYLCDYVLILGILIWKKQQNIIKWKDIINTCTISDWIIWCILTILIIFSFVVMHGIKRISMTTRIKIEPKNDSVWESYSGFLAPAIALIPVFFETYGLLISFAFFVITGIVFVKSKQVHLASVFIFPMGFKIYKGVGNVTVISRDSRDELRLKMADNLDGIEAKELSKGIFLVQ